MFFFLRKIFENFINILKIFMFDSNENLSISIVSKITFFIVQVYKNINLKITWIICYRYKLLNIIFQKIKRINNKNKILFVNQI